MWWINAPSLINLHCLQAKISETFYLFWSFLLTSLPSQLIKKKKKKFAPFPFSIFSKCMKGRKSGFRNSNFAAVLLLHSARCLSLMAAFFFVTHLMKMDGWMAWMKMDGLLSLSPTDLFTRPSLEMKMSHLMRTQMTTDRWETSSLHPAVPFLTHMLFICRICTRIMYLY